MAEKGWTAQMATAAGVAAGTGAAQLGLGYGLGVIEWPAVPADDSVWLGSLGWATWIAASATVFGAVIAVRPGRAAGPWRFALAASAAVGALLTVALIALPARTAVRTDTFSPQTIAGGYAAMGVLLGLVIAYWAVVSRPVAANLIATAAWLWLLAVAGVVTSILWHRPSATYLSSWQFFSPDHADGTISWPSALLTLLAALVVGVIAVLPAVRRGDLGVGAASSGAVGPLLIAATFFTLAPQLTGTPSPLQSAYLIAPYAVLAGLAGSALTVALGQRRAAEGSWKPAEQGGFGGAVSAGADAQASPRRFLWDRFRGKDAGQSPGRGSGDRPATITGRAKATSVEPGAPATATGAVSARRKAPEARPGRSARSGAASVDGSARPVPSSAPGRSDSRSTVTPPPVSPRTAKINDAPSGETATPPNAGQSRNAPSGPTDAATSDKEPSPRKTPAKGTKSVPTARAAPTAKASASPPSADSDTAELPLQDPKARGARRAEGTR